MKRRARPLSLGIGCVVKGPVSSGPETVAAAEPGAAPASPLARPLFPPGSDVAESRIKPEIFTAADPVDRLIAAVKRATVQLVSAGKTGGKGAITPASATGAHAPNARHTRLRKGGENARFGCRQSP